MEWVQGLIIGILGGAFGMYVTMRHRFDDECERCMNKREDECAGCAAQQGQQIHLDLGQGGLM